jgi:hypothetical protein
MSRSEAMPVRAAAAPMILVALYAATVIALPGATGEDVVGIATGHIARNAMLLVMLGLLVTLVFSVSAALRAERRRALAAEIGAFVQPEGRPMRLFQVIAPHFYLALLLAAFSTYKQSVLPAAGFGLDSVFADLDRALFLGVDPWRVTHWLVPGPAGTAFLDTVYMLWFVPMLLIVLLSGFMAPRLQTQYLLAFALVWIVGGTLLAFLLPGAGPCYVEAIHGDARFAPLMERLAAQSEAAIAAGGQGFHALTGQEMLLSVYRNPEHVVFAAGISAMPSIHNALAVLFACAGFACHRAAGWLMTGFAFLIWFGSVHLGWHYALDGIVGAVLALGLWKVAALWTAQLWRAPAAALPAPAVAGGPPLA